LRQLAALGLSMKRMAELRLPVDLRPWAVALVVLEEVLPTQAVVRVAAAQQP
jgi:hypothetical protein